MHEPSWLSIELYGSWTVSRTVDGDGIAANKNFEMSWRSRPHHRGTPTLNTLTYTLWFPNRLA
jgi:hypothetical protein